MKNSLSVQRKHYNNKTAVGFDKNRMNRNHIYKIETIEYFYRKFLKKKNNIRILEVEGGTGLHAEHFLRKEYLNIEQFILLDLSKDMLKVAKKRLKKYKKKVVFLQSPAEVFRLLQPVDCIYISGAMHHFEDPLKAIQNCYDNLTENGVLTICEPVITNPYAWPRVIFMPEEYGQFTVTPHNIVKWLEDNQYEVLEKKWMHYKSNSKFFRFILKLEGIAFMNWSAVMFAVAAKKRS
ncbi:MAG: class I SAM-dependent methyltransferase [Eubacterium sp.]|nr:class I SAM-dependent methyltransferase [Eubacterium sp.]